MNEDFKKWLETKAGYELIVLKEDYIKYKTYFELVLLFNAMVAINRNNNINHSIIMLTCVFMVTFDSEPKKPFKKFLLSDHNNSEQEALTAALNYIFKGE